LGRAQKARRAGNSVEKGRKRKNPPKKKLNQDMSAKENADDIIIVGAGDLTIRGGWS